MRLYGVELTTGRLVAVGLVGAAAWWVLRTYDPDTGERRSETMEPWQRNQNPDFRTTI